MKISDLVKNNTARFSYYRDGTMFYDVVTPDEEAIARFPVDLSDKNEIGTATFNHQEKAITLMRYIRKALAGGTLQTIGL